MAPKVVMCSLYYLLVQEIVNSDSNWKNT